MAIFHFFESQSSYIGGFHVKALKKTPGLYLNQELRIEKYKYKFIYVFICIYYGVMGFHVKALTKNMGLYLVPELRNVKGI